MPTTVPAYLGEAGAALYRSAVDDYDLSVSELAALAQAAETLDVLATLRARIATDGVITPAGRPSPLLAEARQQRAMLVRLLGVVDLHLDDEDPEAVSAARSRSARAAVRSRWSHDPNRPKKAS